MAANWSAPWRRLTTVRARTTIAATAIVGLALLVAAVALVVALRRSLVTNIDEVAEVRAEDIAALFHQASPPTELAASGDDGAVAQVVDAEGVVIASTIGFNRSEPIATFRPTGEDPQSRTIEGELIEDDDEFRVIALATDTSDGPVTVYVASSLEPVEETINILRGALAVGTPILLVLVAATAWVVVGRALRPMEAIRSEVADISDRSLDRRVPVPQTDDEVSRLAETMNTMLDRLEAAAERQRRFVGDASHELRTPLAAARTDLEVAVAHPERTDWQETAADLLTANRRMERLVQDLLFLARADDRVPRPPPVDLDLDDIVLEEVSRLRHEENVTIDAGAVSAAAVRGHREELGRVVRNLLENAARHAESEVSVRLRTDDGEVTLAVGDDGPGIPPEDRERVFERFTRLDGARDRDAGGTGLGLAIAREIVEAHGGTIAVEDSPLGAHLVVRLPAG